MSSQKLNIFNWELSNYFRALNKIVYLRSINLSNLSTNAIVAMCCFLSSYLTISLDYRYFNNNILIFIRVLHNQANLMFT